MTTAIGSSNAQATLAQAQARLAADQAAKAAADIISADQLAVMQDEKAETSSPSAGLIDITA